MSNLDAKIAAFLEKPSWRGWIYALEHKETWPEDFHWDFKQIPCCALGLAHLLWNIPLPNEVMLSSWTDIHFNVCVHEPTINSILYGYWYPEPKPEAIARALRTVISKPELDSNTIRELLASPQDAAVDLA
jgi:hypothetical protein